MIQSQPRSASSLIGNGPTVGFIEPPLYSSLANERGRAASQNNADQSVYSMMGANENRSESDYPRFASSIDKMNLNEHQIQIDDGVAILDRDYTSTAGRYITQTVVDLQRDGQNLLSHLASSQKLTIRQEVDMCEVMCKIIGEVKFSILDDGGNILFYVCEKSNWCARQYCMNHRPHSISIKDRSGRVMMKVIRPIDCSLCCGLIAPDVIDVHLPNHEKLGSVKQNFSLTPSFNIYNSLSHPIMKLTGPYFHATCFSGQTVEFDLIDMQDRKLGKLLKHWSGCGKELYTNCDNFSIEFPVNASPEEKALILASFTLVNIRHYERRNTLGYLIIIILICFILSILNASTFH